MSEFDLLWLAIRGLCLVLVLMAGFMFLLWVWCTDTERNMAVLKSRMDEKKKTQLIQEVKPVEPPQDDDFPGYYEGDSWKRNK